MERIGILGARQIKAARAMLNWSQEDLADAARLSIATVRKLELGYISPRLSTTSVIRQAIEKAGVEFIEPEGVRLRPHDILSFDGQDGHRAFLDDIRQTIGKPGGDILLVETQEPFLLLGQEKNACQDLNNLLDANGTTTIKCLMTDMLSLPLSTPRLEFRFISRHYVDPMPCCIYGNKFAMVVSHTALGFKIIVMHSSCAAQASQKQFLSIWEKATTVSRDVYALPEKAQRKKA